MRTNIPGSCNDWSGTRLQGKERVRARRGFEINKGNGVPLSQAATKPQAPVTPEETSSPQGPYFITQLRGPTAKNKRELFHQVLGHAPQRCRSYILRQR